MEIYHEQGFIQICKTANYWVFIDRRMAGIETCVCRLAAVQSPDIKLAIKVLRTWRALK